MKGLADRVSVLASKLEHMFETASARHPRPITSDTYDGPMAKSARAAAAEIRRRLPGIGTVKVHKLLYYAQGHHLATFGRPLFEETISAWDMGPVVGTLWRQEHQGDAAPVDEPLNEAELNTLGYVLQRYGGLTGKDLIRLSHSESPWQRASEHRRSGTSVRISNEAMSEFFSTADEGDEGDLPVLDSVQLNDMLAEALERRDRPATKDSLEDLAARRAELLG